jgi:signal transduction histidine kinase
LRRFSSENSLNQRVRTFGTVVLQAPGRYLYVQDGADSVFALAEQTDLLHPGDRVEVVGFPGNEGRRFLLREAAYRRISAGPEPSAIQLPVVHSVNFGMEGLLARAEGTVLNILRKDGESRLLVRSGDSTFEASLDPAAGTAGTRELELEAGSQIAVTGVYEIQSDESGKARSYLLRLRSWNDVAVIARPPWWTLARLGWALLAVLAISVMAVIWGVLISRKNALLKQAQGALQTAHDKLELRVEERTHELREQVVAKERARAELAQAQERLILTSRQAGMAEVATGVLHNVGNVLNSVNVSAALLGERLRGCRVESVTKAAALLRQPPDQLAGFLVNDPKGQALPGYLEKLGDVLAQDKKDMQTEVESLTKNVDHIKVIVAMQQSYAKIGGVLEDLDPRDLAEDALQINSGSLERHGVQLVRDYQTTQRVMVDRHKVLQILVNLVTNAVHALKGHPGAKTLKLSLAPAGPGRVHLSVADNGVGIAPENLSQIFSQGFTTRRDGHGFGLHSGANAAKELGGSLSVESAGLGQGAIFTLELPIANGVHKHHVSADGNGNGHSLAE